MRALAVRRLAHVIHGETDVTKVRSCVLPEVVERENAVWSGTRRVRMVHLLRNPKKIE